MSSKRTPKSSSPKPSDTSPDAGPGVGAVESPKKGKSSKAKAPPAQAPISAAANDQAPQASAALRGAISAKYAVDLALEKVLSVATRPGHAEVAVSNRVGRIIALSTATGERLREFKGHESFVSALSFSPDGEQLLSGGNDKTMRVWGAQTGDYDHDMSGIIHASPRATTLMGQMIRSSRPGHNLTVLCLTHGPNGLVGSGGQDRHAKIWRHSQLVRTFDFHEGPVTAVAFRPGTEDLLALSEDRSARLWAHHDGHMIHKYSQGGHTAPARAAAWLNAQRLVTADDAGQILLWDADSERVVARLQAPSGVRSIAITRDGAWAFAGTEGGQLLSIRASSDALDLAQTHKAHPDIIRAVALDEDRRVLITGGHDGIVRFWDLT